MSLPKTFIDGFHKEDQVKLMPLKKLGGTDIHISKLGLGGAAFSGFYNDFDEAEAILTVSEAVQSGINYIDTAPYYGQGRSEILLGKALKQIPRNSYYISTKVGRYTSDWTTMFNYSRSKILAGFENSLRLLELDFIDIIVVHDVEFANRNQILEEALPAVQEIVKSGKARYIAISGYPVSVLADIVKCSTVPIDIILTYSRDTLIDKTLYNYIPFFNEKNLGIINAAPTAMQMLTNVGPQPWHPADAKTKEICAKAVDYCKQHGVELGRLSVFHTMKNKDSHNFLIGMNTRNLLKSNLEVAIKGITEEEQQVLDYLYKNIFPKDTDLQWEGTEIGIYKKHIGKS